MPTLVANMSEEDLHVMSSPHHQTCTVTGALKAAKTATHNATVTGNVIPPVLSEGRTAVIILQTGDWVLL